MCKIQDSGDPCLIIYNQAVDLLDIELKRGMKILEIGCREEDWAAQIHGLLIPRNPEPGGGKNYGENKDFRTRSRCHHHKR